jgi:RNA polymerase-binding transcription factor DksA
MNLEHIKKLLISLRQDVEARIENTQRHIKHSQGPLSQDFAEQASERANDDVVYHLDELAKQELALINQALEKIEKGEYGLCTACSSKIEDARLAAVPYAGLCKHCAEQQQ